MMCRIVVGTKNGVALGKRAYSGLGMWANPGGMGRMELDITNHTSLKYHVEYGMPKTNTSTLERRC